MVHRAHGGALLPRTHERAMVEAIRSSMCDARKVVTAAWTLATPTGHRDVLAGHLREASRSVKRT